MQHTHDINHVKDHYLLVTTHTYVLQVTNILCVQLPSWATCWNALFPPLFATEFLQDHLISFLHFII